MAESQIIKALLKATKLPPQGDADRQTFLQRVAEAASDESKMDSETWEGLPKTVQSWVNAAIKALNAEKDIPEPDEGPKKKKKNDDDAAEDDTNVEADAEEDAEEDTDDDADEESDDDGDENEDEEDNEESEMTTTKAKKGAAKKKVAAPKKTAAKKKATAAAPKKAKSNGTAAPRGTGAQTVIKQLMLKDPNISTEDLINKLEKKGLKPTKIAVTSIRSGMRHTLRVMADAGVLHSSIKLGMEA